MQHHETSPMIPISHGRGAWLFDADGNRYLDGVSSWWVNLFGHANPRINAALKDQLDKLEHVMLAGFTHEPVITLSERLSEKTGNVLGHCAFASDGASAVEMALKMSVHSWHNRGFADKREYVCLQGSYHGETIGALSVTNEAWCRHPYDSLLNAVHVVMSPDARQANENETAQDVARRAIADVEKLFGQHSKKIAAIIVEPLVQCAGSFAMHDPLYLTLLRALCDQYQVHLIADEIAVGCGRTGTFFACEQADIWPDFLCLSKGISGGYLPLSLVMTTDEIYHTFYHQDTQRAFLHSHTYSGNPLACRAALAALDIFEEDNVLATNRIRAAKLTEVLMPLARHSRVSNFRQRGMIWAFDVPEAQAGFSLRFFTAALKQELLLRPIGKTVHLMPPYILDDEEMTLLGQRTLATLEHVL